MTAHDTLYLDNQSTTACDPRVLDAMWPFFADDYANPHSPHRAGLRAEAAVETARDRIAALLGANSREIVLTSGATEANNLAIKGVARHALAGNDPRRRIVTVATEHPCVTETVRDLAREGFEPVFLPVHPDGRLDLDALDDALHTPTLLVSVMAANNETGVLHDLAAIAERVHQAGALLHSDAAQATGKVAFEPAALGVDLASLSAHKMHGPKGIGALYVRRRPRIRLEPLFSGGGQERGLRSGTLATPLIVGLGVACRIAATERATEQPRVAALRDRLLALLEAAIPGLAVNGSRTDRLAGNLNLRFPGIDAPALLAAAPELAASTGSACGSAAIEPSTVLRAMGLTRAEAAASLRLGLGRFTSPADIERAASILVSAYARVRAAAVAPRQSIEA